LLGCQHQNRKSWRGYQQFEDCPGGQGAGAGGDAGFDGEYAFGLHPDLQSAPPDAIPGCRRGLTGEATPTIRRFHLEERRFPFPPQVIPLRYNNPYRILLKVMMELEYKIIKNKPFFYSLPNPDALQFHSKMGSKQLVAGLVARYDNKSKSF
jgi:hypothetical protein